MDEDAGFAFRDPVISITGLSHEVAPIGGPGADPSAFLKVKKSRKFMGVQDDLAVLCAGRALESANLAATPLGERTGLYLAVGYIPFQESDIGPVLDASTEDGRFSMRRFAEGGYQKAHPLLTFKCLPNMPAYHVSVNFDIQGPYLVTYPGPAQLYAALEEAVTALREGRIDIALVGGVAHQRNFLVEHHYRRIEPPVPAERLRDAGAMMILETEEHARERGGRVFGSLRGWDHSIDPSTTAPVEAGEWGRIVAVDPRSGRTVRNVTIAGPRAETEVGPASLPLLLSEASAAMPGWQSIEHEIVGRDGIYASSMWVREEVEEIRDGEAG